MELDLSLVLTIVRRYAFTDGLENTEIHVSSLIFYFSLSVFFLQGMSPNPLLTHHPSSIPQKDKEVHIFNNAFRVHIGYALRMSNCRF